MKTGNKNSSKMDKQKPDPKRGKNTLTFPCADAKTYMNIVKDIKLFKNEIVNQVEDLIDENAHKPGCIGKKKYYMAGFRKNPRTSTHDGIKLEFPIRMIRCINCGQKFSILPSFLPKEKHFSLNKNIYIFPCNNPKTYIEFIKDNKLFRQEIVDHLGEWAEQTGHKPECSGDRNYKMRGFRWKPHRVLMPDGNYQEFPIRIVQCKNCGQKFSLFPSFLKE